MTEQKKSNIQVLLEKARQFRAEMGTVDRDKLFGTAATFMEVIANIQVMIVSAEESLKSNPRSDMLAIKAGAYDRIYGILFQAEKDSLWI